MTEAARSAYNHVGNDDDNNNNNKTRAKHLWISTDRDIKRQKKAFQEPGLGHLAA